MCEIRLIALILAMQQYGINSIKCARVIAWVSGRTNNYLRLY